MLLLVVHSVQEPSAKVPFAMMALLDIVKKKQVPGELKCRQVFPTGGTRSTSLWDAPDLEFLQNYLDEVLPAECNSEVFQVQEDFAYGISAELTRIRATERVTENTRATAAAVQNRAQNAAADAHLRMGEIDAKLKVTEHAAAAYKTARETSQAAAKRTAEMFGKVGQQAQTSYSKALENERISAAATAINTNLNVGWRTLSSGLGFKSATPAPAGSSPADAPKQEPDAAVEASGSSGPPKNGAKGVPAAGIGRTQEDEKEQAGSLFTLDDLEEEQPAKDIKTAVL